MYEDVFFHPRQYIQQTLDVDWDLQQRLREIIAFYGRVGHLRVNRLLNLGLKKQHMHSRVKWFKCQDSQGVKLSSKRKRTLRREIIKACTVLWRPVHASGMQLKWQQDNLAGLVINQWMLSLTASWGNAITDLEALMERRRLANRM